MNNNTFSLEPYNHWILWISLVLLAVFIVYTGAKAAGLLKNVKSLQEKTENIQKQVKLASIKAEVLKENKAEKEKKNKPFKIIMPVVLAAWQLYKTDDNLKGLKGMRKAAASVVRNEREQKKFIQRTLDAMH